MNSAKKIIRPNSPKSTASPEFKSPADAVEGFIGKLVRIETVFGEKFEGTLIGMRDAADKLIVVRTLTNNNVVIILKNVSLINALTMPISVEAPNAGSFKTDTNISKIELKEKPLKKWVPDNPLEEFVTLSQHKGNWDQFAANEKLFGLQTTFHEEIYTTKLDRNSPAYHEKAKEAERLANEILSSNTSNVHLAEDRGHQMDDSQMNEEDRYGAVLRKATKEKQKEQRKLSVKLEPIEAANVTQEGGKPGRKFSIQVQLNEDSKDLVVNQIPKPDSDIPAKVIKEFKEFSAHEKTILSQKKELLIKKERASQTSELKAFSLSMSAKLNPVLKEASNVEKKKTTFNLDAPVFKPTVANSPTFISQNEFLGDRKHTVSRSLKEEINKKYFKLHEANDQWDATDSTYRAFQHNPACVFHPHYGMVSFPQQYIRS